MDDAAELSRLSRLREILVDRFSDGELRTLCFDLGVDYDVLPGEGKADKARELVAYLDRRGQSEQIAVAGQRLRPDIDWGGVPAPAAEGETPAPTGRPQDGRQPAGPAISGPSEWAAREGGITVGGNLEVHGDLAGRDIVRDNVTVYAPFGPLAPQMAQAARAAEVERLIAGLRDHLAALDLPERTRLVGQEFVDELDRELAKTGEPPDASTIKVAGQWLLRNIPDLSEALAGLFRNPIVGEVVQAAGEVAASWVCEQFGVGN